MPDSPTREAPDPRARLADLLFWSGFAAWHASTFTQGVGVPGLPAGVSWNIVGALALWCGAAAAWALRLPSGESPAALRREPAFLLPSTALAALVGVGAAWWLFASLLGEVRDEAIRSARLAILSPFNAFLVACYAARRRDGLLPLARIAVALATLAALVGIAEFALKRDLLVKGVDTSGGQVFRVNGVAPNPIVYGFHMAFAAPLALYLAARERRAWLGWLAAIALGAILLAGMLTLNRQTFVVLAASLGAGFLVLRGRRLAWLALAVALAALAIAPKALPKIVERLEISGDLSRDISLRVRRDSFLNAMEATRARPWTGIGLGQFPLTWKSHLAEGTFYAQYHEQSVRWYIDMGYMQALAESGWPGLLLFAALWFGSMGQALWLCLRARGRGAGDGSPDSEDADAGASRLDYANACACLFALAATLALNSLTQDTLLRPRVWLVWALAAMAPRFGVAATRLDDAGVTCNQDA